MGSKERSRSRGLRSRQDLCFRIARPQGVFALEGRDRLNGVRPPDGLRAGFRQPEVLDLAFRDKVLHRAGDVLDRHVRVDAVLVEEVDPVGPEALRATLPRPP